MNQYQTDFIKFAIDNGILNFGEYKLRSGRNSPYFFNLGFVNSGSKLNDLGKFYCRAMWQHKIELNMLYGPAYKGIPIVCAAASSYCTLQDIPFAFNRKEVKDHGEGGSLIGSALDGDVLILDDVITEGVSITESINIIRNEGANPCGVLIALDRQEIGLNGLSATEEVTKSSGIPVYAIINLDDIIEYLKTNDSLKHHLKNIEKYQRYWGVVT